MSEVDIKQYRSCMEKKLLQIYFENGKVAIDELFNELGGTKLRSPCDIVFRIK